jgi:hypothetical protein
MKVDFSKYQEVIIKDKDGKVVDRFLLSSVSTVKSKLTGNRIELTKR